MFALLAASSLVVAAGSPRSPSVPIGPHTIVDQRGRRVVLADRIERQAVLFGTGPGPFIMANRRPRSVVTSPTSESRWIAASSYFERAIPGASHLSETLQGDEGAALNLEEVLAHKPDLVVTWGRLAQTFERLGLSVVGIAPISSAEMMFGEEALFAALAGRTSNVGRLRAELDRVGGAVRVHPGEDRIRFLALHALDDGRWQIAHPPAEVVQSAAGIDIGRVSWGTAVIDTEELLSMDPDAMIFIGSTFGNANGTALPRAFCSLRAIREGRVVDAPAGLSGYMIAAVEMPLYAVWLADLLHPGQTMLSVDKETVDVLQSAFGVAPTSQEIRRMYPRITPMPLCKAS